MKIMVLVGFFALLVAAGQSGTKGKPEAHLQISVLGYPLTDPLPKFHVELTEVGSGNDFSKNVIVKEGICTANVPYGYYNLRVKAVGFTWQEEHVTAMQPKISFRVFMPVARLSDEPINTCRGRINPAPPGNEKLYVRLLPLTGSNHIAENEVFNGAFEVTGLPFGEYILTVMKGTKSIFMKQITMLPSTEITINLPPSPQ